MLEAFLDYIGGKLVLTQPHHLPQQLLNDLLPAAVLLSIKSFRA